MKNNEPIFEIKNLSKVYPTFTLDNISFNLLKGRICGFIGRNGAGKTTTLKCCYNLAKPSSGEVLYNGLAFTKNEAEIKEDIGLLFGGIDYYPNKRAKDLAKVTSKFYKKWDNDLFAKYLRFFGIDENKKIKELSNGMKVKFGLSLALSHGAKVLLLDEPTSGLDPVSRDELLDCFLKIVEKNEVAILFSTHVISDLDRCADDISYIKEGKLVFSGKVEDFSNEYVHIEGDVKDLSNEARTILGKTLIHNKKISCAVRKEDKDLFKGFKVSSPSLEEIMLYIERKSENEESPF